MRKCHEGCVESHTRGFCIDENLATGLHSPTLMLLWLVWIHAFVIAFTIVLPNLCHLPLWSHLPIEIAFKECTCTTGDHVYSCVKTTKPSITLNGKYLFIVFKECTCITEDHIYSRVKTTKPSITLNGKYLFSSHLINK